MKKVTKAFIENKCKWKGFDVHCNRGKWYLLLAVNNKVNKTIKNKNQAKTIPKGKATKCTLYKCITCSRKAGFKNMTIEERQKIMRAENHGAFLKNTTGNTK